MLGIFNAIILSISLVITRQEIIVALPPGTVSDEVTEYLTSVGGDYSYFTRETERIISPAFPWTEAEVGYYFTNIDDVRTKWWMPSLGINYRIRVGITAEGVSTQVVIHEAVNKGG